MGEINSSAGFQHVYSGRVLSRTGRQKDNPKGVDETYHSLHQHNSSTYTVQFNKETTKTTTTSSEVLSTYLHLHFVTFAVQSIICTYKLLYTTGYLNLKCFETEFRTTLHLNFFFYLKYKVLCQLRDCFPEKNLLRYFLISLLKDIRRK